MSKKTLIVLLTVLVILPALIIMTINGIVQGWKNDSSATSPDGQTTGTTQATTEATTQATTEATTQTTEPQIDDSTIPIVIVPGTTPTEPAVDPTEPPQTTAPVETTEPSAEQTKPTSGDWEDINFGDLLNKN